MDLRTREKAYLAPEYLEIGRNLAELAIQHNNKIVSGQEIEDFF